MEHGYLTLIAAGAVAIGLLARFAHRVAFRERRARRELAQIPSRYIKDAIEREPVRITGNARPLQIMLTAPLTERSCMAFEVEIRSYARGVDPDMDRVRRMTSFLIDDPTGTAIVDNGQLLLVTDMGRKKMQLPPRMETFLVYEGKDTGKVMEVREGVIEPGSRVTVYGVAHWEVDPEQASERGYRDTPLRLRFESTPETKVIISNDPTVLDQ